MTRFSLPVLVLAVLAWFAPPAALAGGNRLSHEASGSLTWASPQSNPIAITPNGAFVFVANTTSNSVEVINTAADTFWRRVEVGVEPVSVAVKPDGSEVWVANHVSDSISVIDNNAASPTYLKVIRTIQDVDGAGVSQFDEPVGIAFKEDGSKAYVTLSSRNDIAVVDTATYLVNATRVHVTAQDPRALAVRNNRLFVAAFESDNQSEVSACGFSGSPPQCTLFVTDLITFATNPNLPGLTKHIVIDPDAPDRDLFVYDVSGATPTLLESVSGVGTLLYGVAVDGSGNVYVTNAEARNAENGLDGDSLADLQNRMFLNRVTKLSCGGGNPDPCTGAATHIELDAAVGTPPSPGTQLATPFGVAVSGNNGWLVGTAAGSSRIFVLDLNASLGGTPSSAVAARLDVGSIPRGVALRSDPGTGAPVKAYVLNTLGNSVTVVNLATPSSPSVVKTVGVGLDPTPTAVRLGRIAFNDANASTEGTFSCASCHPDGNTDQLLWRIGGACFFGACTGEEEPRTTMPVRGLRDTLPLHWDGTLGDPFGGPDGSTGSGGSAPAVCSPSNPQACFRDLVNESLAGVMCAQPCGSGGELDNATRDDMSVFLESVSYPPARERTPDDVVSAEAADGFRDFFFDQNGGGNPDTCADSNAGCHELPLGTATNSEVLQAFDAPTMRGMTDRFLQFSLGLTNAEELLAFANIGLPAPPFNIPPLESSIQWSPAQGFEEITTFGVAFAIFDPTYGVRPLDIFQMFEEASTGHSGALGRQVTVGSGNWNDAAIDAALAELELADEHGFVNLRGSATNMGSGKVFVSYDEASQSYLVDTIGFLTRADFLAKFQGGQQVLRTATLTAHLRAGIAASTPQPLIAPLGANCGTGNGPTGDPNLDLPNNGTIDLEAAHVTASDVVVLNGAPVAGATITILGPANDCASTAGQIATDEIRIALGFSPSNGMHLLQVQTAGGLLSNEVPLCKGSETACNS